VGAQEHEQWAPHTNMSIQFLRQLYSLDTLDTRFVIPANAPPKEALEYVELSSVQTLPFRNEQAKSRDAGLGSVRPSRWNTPEFYAYCLVISACIPFMFKSVVDVSKGW